MDLIQEGERNKAGSTRSDTILKFHAKRMMILDAANYSNLCKSVHGNVNKRRWTMILKNLLLFF